MKTITENYHGEVYHFTSLIQAVWIFSDNCLDARTASCEDGWGNESAISFTRDKNYRIQGNDATSVCFVFDGDTIQNVRNARLRPFAYNGRGEAEERLYGVQIYPLNKYVKRVEVKVANGPYAWASDRGYEEEDELYEKFEEKYPDLTEEQLGAKIQEYLLKKLKNSRRFAGKVQFVQNVSENSNHWLRNIISEAIDKVLYPVR